MIKFNLYHSLNISWGLFIPWDSMNTKVRKWHEEECRPQWVIVLQTPWRKKHPQNPILCSLCLSILSVSLSYAHKLHFQRLPVSFVQIINIRSLCVYLLMILYFHGCQALTGSSYFLTIILPAECWWRRLFNSWVQTPTPSVPWFSSSEDYCWGYFMLHHYQNG